MSRILPSARCHGVKDSEIEKAWTRYIWEIVETEEPRKVIRLGFDDAARLLEIGGVLDGEEWIVIHAMKAREKYVRRIPLEVRWFLG